MEASGKASVAFGKTPRRIMFTFCNLLRDKKKKTKTEVPKWILPTCPKKFSDHHDISSISP